MDGKPTKAFGQFLPKINEKVLGVAVTRVIKKTYDVGMREEKNEKVSQVLQTASNGSSQHFCVAYNCNILQMEAKNSSIKCQKLAFHDASFDLLKGDAFYLVTRFTVMKYF